MRIAAKKEEPHRLDAGLLIPGRGSPIKGGSLIWSGKTILYAGATSSLPSKYGSLEPTYVPVVMPGLWDCHVHFVGTAALSVEAMSKTPPAVSGMRCARDIAATLNAGFTSVREVAGYGVQLAQVIGEGWLPGPNVYSSVAMLSQTAGHGDERSLSLEQVHALSAQGLPLHLCDGPSECVKAVRTMMRRGAQVIKLAASGGVLSDGDDITARQFDDAELAAIVGEATRNNLNVAAHCHAKESILAALRAGVRTIEHGTYMDDECVALLKEKDAMLVATRSVVEFVTADPAAWPPDTFAQLLDMKRAHAQSYRAAVKAGVRCALGTDLGASAATVPFNHGMNGAEFARAVDTGGMTPLQAIEAGTANAPLTLGKKAPKSGQLLEGYDADFIALNHSPVDDIALLSEPKNITHVWKGGRLFKKGGRAVNMLDIVE